LNTLEKQQQNTEKQLSNKNKNLYKEYQQIDELANLIF